MIIKKKKKMSIAEVNYKLQKLFMKKALIVLALKLHPCPLCVVIL